MFWTAIGYTLIDYLPDYFLIGLIYFIIYRHKWCKLEISRRIINTIFYLYVATVIHLTISPAVVSIVNIGKNGLGVINLSPFIDIVEGHLNAQREAILNILMLVPFGILYPIYQNVGFKKTVSTALLLSLGIECLQPLLNSYRAADITDVITNTIGALLGFLIYRMIKNVRH